VRKGEGFVAKGFMGVGFGVVANGLIGTWKGEGVVAKGVMPLPPAKLVVAKGLGATANGDGAVPAPADIFLKILGSTVIR